MLESSQVDKSRKPQDHQDGINGKHGVLVKEATAGLTMARDGKRRVEKEIGHCE